MDIIFPVSDENCGADTSIAQVLTTCNTEPALRVVVCGEKDFSQTILCAPDGTKVAVQTVWDHETNTNITSYWDLVLGAVWAGDPATLTACPDVDVESDPQEMCDAGVPFIRWTVKSNGEPTGVYYDTDVNNVPYVPVGLVTFGACTTDADIVDCEIVESTCVGYQDVSNFATATNANVLLEFSFVSGTIYHVAVEDGAFTGLFGLVSTAISSFDGLRLFDDVLAPNPGMRLWAGGISNVTSFLGGRRIEFDYDVSAAPATPCAATVLAENTIAEGLFGGSAPSVGFVAFVSLNLVETTTTVTRKSLSVNLDPCTINALNTTVDTQYTACDDTIVPVTVDSVVGAYVLNQEYKHTEMVYDNITASLGGTINTLITGTSVAFDLTTITATNWIGNIYAIEFGNGYTDVGNNPTFDFANEPDGNYEIKIYRVFAFPEGFRWFLVAPIEIIKTGSTVTVATVNPFPVLRSITYTVKELLQDYCGNTPVGSPYNVDGSPATVTGFLSLSFRDDETEWLGMSDANNGSTVDTFDCVSPGITAVEGADVNIQATTAYIGAPVTTRHTQLGSTLNLLGTSSGNAMGSGVEIVSTGSSVQTVTFTVEVVNDSDPGSPDADFGVCIIDNSTGLVIPANSITGPPLVYDAAGLGGLGYPIYNSVASGNTYTITWVGTIPVGSFTAVFTGQDQVNPGSEDNFNVQIVTPIVAGSSTTAQVVHLDDCTIAALTAEPVPAVEIPGGLVIVNDASLPVIAGTSFVHSFSVKALFGSTYEISFDNGATWSPPIDGADSWGEGTIELVDVTNVVVRPSVSGMTTFVHWEV
jgi:hypothetical protein